MKSELEQKLNKQVVLQWWILGLGLSFIMGFVLLIAGSDSTVLVAIGFLILFGTWIVNPEKIFLHFRLHKH